MAEAARSGRRNSAPFSKSVRLLTIRRALRGKSARPGPARGRVSNASNFWVCRHMHTIYLILFWSTPAVIALAAIEAAALLAIRRGAYDWRAAFCSLADLLVRQYVVYAYLAFGLLDWLTGWAWTHRLWTVPLGTATSIAVLFIGQEFC